MLSSKSGYDTRAHTENASYCYLFIIVGSELATVYTVIHAFD